MVEIAQKVFRPIRISPWKAAGLDTMVTYWIEKFMRQLNDVVQNTKVPSGLTKERNRLISKDPTNECTLLNFGHVKC